MSRSDMRPSTIGQPRLGLTPMRPRDPGEPGRTANPLELFFDLVFVVAVSIAASELHHAISDRHATSGLQTYAIVFFSVWWAWVNFTWFATSFGTDDWLYRILSFVQMAGVLVLAAGIPDAFSDGRYELIVSGYALMRVALVAQWLRASRRAGDAIRVTRTSAAGIAFVQVLWLIMLNLPEATRGAAVVVLILAEVAIPIIAQRTGNSPWHPHHIAERYGLFTLILLGESLLASTNAIIEALHDTDTIGPLLSTAALTFVVTVGLWWIYFWPAHHAALDSFARSLRYGYVHYFIFAAAGAFSAGVEVHVDVLTGRSGAPEMTALWSVALPVAVFVLGIWWLVIREQADRVVNVAVPSGAFVVLCDPLLPVPFVLTAIVIVVMVVVLTVRRPVGEPQS